MAKNREDFTDAELRKLHEELSKAQTKDDRAAIYERIGATGQAVGQWFRRMNLPALGTLAGKPAGAKRRGRPPGTKNKKGPGRPKGKGASKGPGRPKSVGTNVKASGAGNSIAGKVAGVRGPKSTGRGLGLSLEAKEAVIRLLSLILED